MHHFFFFLFFGILPFTTCREAAKACRLRRKEYIRCLESHNALLEMHNKQLIQELEAYRNMYMDRTSS